MKKEIIELAYNVKYWTELGRIHNFPKIKNTKNRYTGEGSEWEQFLNDNILLKEILIKIGNKIFNGEYQIESDMYCELELFGNFDNETDIVHFHVSGDSCIVITDTMDYFSNKYKTYEDWRVNEWKSI
jgi:hypothetical protein